MLLDSSPKFGHNFDPVLMHEVLLHAAASAYGLFNVLGKRGAERDLKRPENRFGQKSLIVDTACEDKVIQAIARGVSMGKLPPLEVISEENARGLILGDKSKVGGVLMADGYDGSSYGARCLTGDIPGCESATIFGLYRGVTPTFGDCVASVAVQHSLCRCLIAVEGQTPRRYYLGTKQAEEIHADPRPCLKPTVVIDPNFDKHPYAAKLRAILAEISTVAEDPEIPACSAAHMLRVVANRTPNFSPAEDVFIRRYDMTENLEVGSLMRLITALGGIAITGTGERFDHNRVHSFLYNKPNALVIIARTPAIGTQFVAQLKERAGELLER